MNLNIYITWVSELDSCIWPSRIHYILKVTMISVIPYRIISVSSLIISVNILIFIWRPNVQSYVIFHLTGKENKIHFSEYMQYVGNSLTIKNIPLYDWLKFQLKFILRSDLSPDDRHTHTYIYIYIIFI